jgi:hypothetical protein
MAGNARTNRTARHARAQFLEELARRGIVSDACKAAGVARRTAYEWRAADTVFAAAWDEALDQAVDTMEREAHRRAVEGVEEPVIGRVERDRDGILTDEDGNPLYIRKYSDSLLTTMLKANRPEKYRERTDVHHSGAIAVEFVNDWRTTDA